MQICFKWKGFKGSFYQQSFDVLYSIQLKSALRSACLSLALAHTHTHLSPTRQADWTLPRYKGHFYTLSHTAYQHHCNICWHWLHFVLLSTSSSLFFCTSVTVKTSCSLTPHRKNHTAQSYNWFFVSFCCNQKHAFACLLNLWVQK